MKKLLFLLIAIGLTGAGLTYWWHNTSTEQGAVPAYTLLAVERGRIADLVQATGVVQPHEVYTVGTELSGKAVAVYADFNDQVVEGQPLLQLDDQFAREKCTQSETALRLATLGIEQARTRLSTAQKLVQRLQSISPEVRRESDLEVAQGQLQQAELALRAAHLKQNQAEQARQQARRALRLTTIRVPVLAQERGDARVQTDAMLEVKSQPSVHSPEDGPGSLPLILPPSDIGVPAKDGNPPPQGEEDPSQRQSFLVLDRKVSLNQMIAPPVSGHLFTLVSTLERMQVRVQVVEGDIHKIRRGQPAEFTISGEYEEGPRFQATVEAVRLRPTSTRGAVFYTVLLNVRNRKNPKTREWLLRPGQTTSADIQLRVHEDTWKLPTAALNFEPPQQMQSKEARAKLARWQQRKDYSRWRVVWVPGTGRFPEPIFVRTEGRNRQGETGIQDDQFTEILEWDPEMTTTPDPHDPATYPRVIIGIPKHKKGGLFKLPKVRL